MGWQSRKEVGKAGDRSQRSPGVRIWVRPVPSGPQFSRLQKVLAGGGVGGGVRDRKAPLNLKGSDSKRAGASGGRDPPLCREPWEGCAGRWGLRRGAGVRGRGRADPRSPGEAGSGGGRAWDLRAPPRRGQPARCWGGTASSPRRRRRPAAAAAIREVRDGFLLCPAGRRPEPRHLRRPPPTQTLAAAGRPTDSPRGPSEGPPPGPGRRSSGGAAGAARGPPPPSGGPGGGGGGSGGN